MGRANRIVDAVKRRFLQARGRVWTQYNMAPSVWSIPTGYKESTEEPRS